MSSWQFLFFFPFEWKCGCDSYNFVVVGNLIIRTPDTCIQAYQILVMILWSMLTWLYFHFNARLINGVVWPERKTRFRWNSFYNKEFSVVKSILFCSRHWIYFLQCIYLKSFPVKSEFCYHFFVYISWASFLNLESICIDLKYALPWIFLCSLSLIVNKYELRLKSYFRFSWSLFWTICVKN